MKASFGNGVADGGVSGPQRPAMTLGWCVKRGGGQIFGPR